MVAITSLNTRSSASSRCRASRRDGSISADLLRRTECSIGQGFEAAKLAYSSNKRGFEKDDGLIGPDGGPPTLATIYPLAERRNYLARMVDVFAPALEECLSQVPTSAYPVPICLIVDIWLEDHPILKAFLDEIRKTFRAAIAGISVRFGESPDALLLLGFEAKAMQDGERGDVIVASVASFIHSSLLDQLQVERRLLCQGNPYGFIPGECACAFFLSREGSSSDLPRAMGSILAVFKSREPTKDDSAPAVFSGKALASIFHKAATFTRPDRLLLDLKGERWRAEEAGFALARVGSSFAHLNDKIEAPALNVGDCGMAMGQLLAAFSLFEHAAVEAEQGQASLVSASAVSGTRAVAMLERFTR